MRFNQDSDKNITVFTPEIELEGVLEFTDNVVITGNFSGTINSSGNLEIAKDANCAVDSIKAENIVIAGKVLGNLSINDRTELKTGCKVSGDITTTKLCIEDGVDFDGDTSMIAEKPDFDIFSMSNSELKDSFIGVKNINNSESLFDEE